jgi:hypothetical protein
MTSTQEASTQNDMGDADGLGADPIRRKREKKVLAGLLSTENWLRNVQATVKAQADEIEEIRKGLEGDWTK